MLKAIIADLDNTIYPVISIGDILFKPLIEIIEEYREELDENKIQEIKTEMMKKPWQQIAEKHELNNELKQRGTELLEHLTYDLPMQPYDDYQYLQQVNAQKFLVTMGFMKLQQSKVKQLNLNKDFEQVIVVDPQTTEKTKQDIFKEILEQHQLSPDEVLAVGDDPDSEIKAAKGLGIVTYLFDEHGVYPPKTADYQYNTLAHLPGLLS